MKRLYIFILILTSSIAALATPVGPMNYQGRLLDNAGIPVTGAYDFVVKIYDDPAVGTLKYQETHSDISVEDGVYSFKVGTGSNVIGTWDINLWQGNLNDLYLELVVEGETLTPRHELTSAPHAFTSTFALSANALGNKTAAEYDNILEGVCVASKGVWLEKVGKCLGAGASFPGPTLTALSSYTDKNNLSGIDLTGANVSGINFAANTYGWTTYLTNAIFKNTIYSVQGINGTDLSESVWDNAIASDAGPYTLSSSTNLAKVSFKNMAMNKWDLSGMSYEFNYDMLSAAYLSSCPAGLPNNWQPWICKLMHTGGDKYFLFGPRANFSITSAAAKPGIGGIFLDLDADVFDGHQWGYASFEGVTITQNFYNSFLYFSKLDNATIRNVNFYGTNFNGATLKGAVLENVTFASEMWGGIGADFTNAKLTNVVFDCNVTSTFDGAILRQVHFTNSLGQATFTNATLDNVSINYFYANWPVVTFNNTRIYGDFYVKNLQDGNPEYLELKDAKFYGATIKGDFVGASFTGAPVYINTEARADLCAANIPHTGSAPHVELAGLKFSYDFTRCPDGIMYGDCNEAGLSRMTPASLPTCFQ